MLINKSLLQKYPQLKYFDKVILKGLEEDKISLKTVLILMDLSHPDRDFLFKIIQEYNLGVNKQLELLSLALAISKRDGILCNDLISGIEKQIADKKLEGGNRAKFLLSYLREKRYPISTKFKKEFSRKKAMLEKEGFLLHFPVNLDEEGYKIEIFFRDYKDFEEKIKKLETIIQKMDL